MVAFAAFLLLNACAGTPEEPDRVVAIGDLHGDLDNAVSALRLAKLVDEAGNWSGGRTTLVQTGDTTDRGPDSKAVIDLLDALRPQAAAAGGRVVMLLGNHEVMNLVGDWRYVSPGDLEAFGGLDARKRAFAPTGEYGVLLSKLDATALVGDAIFVHGGIAPDWAEHGIDGINDRIRAAITGGDGTILGEGGPLWYRGFVTQPETAACPGLNKSLAALGAKRMVVGHTTRRDGRIQVRCDGRLHIIDTGISDHYGAHVAIWEMIDGNARAIYPETITDLEDPTL
jgi:hypothetical protein